VVDPEHVDQAAYTIAQYVYGDCRKTISWKKQNLRNDSPTPPAPADAGGFYHIPGSNGSVVKRRSRLITGFFFLIN